MLISVKLAADFSRGCAPQAMQPPISATHPHPETRKNRSSSNWAPARSGSLAALAWTALRLRVDVDHHPSDARAPLAGHPRIALRVIYATLEASHAGALLVGTCSF